MLLGLLYCQELITAIVCLVFFLPRIREKLRVFKIVLHAWIVYEYFLDSFLLHFFSLLLYLSLINSPIIGYNSALFLVNESSPFVKLSSPSSNFQSVYILLVFEVVKSVPEDDHKLKIENLNSS